MGTPEFPDLGKHCSVETCKQIDFLPFSCDKCQQVFCLDHRGYGQHKCPNALVGDIAVLVCPVCAKSVKMVSGEDANVTWERHTRAGCDPSNYAKATKKQRCKVAGCKETLTFSNRFECKTCKQDVCLKHRFPTEHGCREAAAALVGPSMSERFFQGLRNGATAAGFSTTTTSNSSASNGKARGGAAGKGGARMGGGAVAPVDPANTLRGSAARRMEGWDLGQRERERRERERRPESAQAGGRVNPSGASSSGGEGAELCHQCGARFSTVTDLIAHAEAHHAAGWQSAPGADRGGGAQAGSGTEPCPQCGRRFPTAVALVNHVETDHPPRRASENCVVS